MGRHSANPQNTPVVELTTLNEMLLVKAALTVFFSIAPSLTTVKPTNKTIDELNRLTTSIGDRIYAAADAIHAELEKDPSHTHSDVDMQIARILAEAAMTAHQTAGVAIIPMGVN